MPAFSYVAHLGAQFISEPVRRAPLTAKPRRISGGVVWDVLNNELRIQNRGTPEQHVSAEGGVLGSPCRPVHIDGTVHPLTHLGFLIYAIQEQEGLFYSPALELAMIYEEAVSEGTHEYVVQSVQSGEPNLSLFENVGVAM